MSKYSEQLLDPRWQKMRLHILERDSFTCVSCASGEKTLHVHHTFYEKGKAPWEYPAESLLTLCDDCHKERAEYERKIMLALTSIKSNEVLQGVAHNMSCAKDLADVIFFGTVMRGDSIDRVRRAEMEAFEYDHAGAS
jgi:hypothetical protein